MRILRPEIVQDVLARAFERMGARPEDAAQVSAALVRASLCGYDSHGVLRLAPYHEAWKAGLLHPAERPVISRETAFAAQVDGRYALGQLTARFAADVAIQKARRSGVGIVTATKCCDVGRLAEYAEAIKEAGLIGLVMVNDCGAGQCVVPSGGMQPRLSTNPIALGIPGEKGPGILLDFATSIVAYGKVRQLFLRGEAAPLGWLIDANGKPTTDPTCLFAEPKGALLPVGGHKGYALSLAVEVLSGILSGAGFANPQGGPDGMNGLFILALDVTWFLPPEEFRCKVDQLTEYVKSSKPIPGGTPVQIPGEPDQAEAARRARDGIPLSDQAWATLAAALTDLGLAADLPTS